MRTAMCMLALLATAPAQSFGQDVVTITDIIDGGSGGLAVDADGNIYLGDFGPSLSGHGTRVFRSTPEGDVSVFASGFDGASGNDFDSQGNLFQSNINAGRIDRIAPNGTVTPVTSVGIFGPVGIAIDENDTAYICNCGSNDIRSVTSAGVSSLYAGSPLFSCPNGITIADDGNLYVSNFNNGNVLRITPSRTVSVHATVPGGNNGHLTFYDGLLYVAARGAHRIYTVTLDGEVSLYAGNGAQGVVDGPLLQAGFSYPNDVIVDPAGPYMYVNDVVDATSSTDTSPMVLRRIDMTTAVGVAGAEASPPSIVSHVAYPNPFRSSTTISYALREAGPVRLALYDVSGRRLRALIDRSSRAGDHEVTWHGRDDAGRRVSPGVYFYRLSTSNGSVTGRIQRQE